MTDHDSSATPVAPAPAVPVAAVPVAAVPAPGSPAPGAAPDAPPADEERALRRTRRRKAAVRWGAAAVVCALAGTGSALAVTARDRTDLPGLATENDGRYTFPALVLPPLPSGKAAPKDNKNRHAAELRHLLLPVPVEAGGSRTPAVFPRPAVTGSATGGAGQGASTGPGASGSPTATASAPAAGPDGADCNALAAEHKDPARLRALLLQYACRAATVREWTASDGTWTQIRLLSFGSSHEAWPVFVALRDGEDPKDTPGLGKVTPQGWDEVYGVTLAARQTRTAHTGADPATRLAYLTAGDLVGVVTMTNPRGVSATAFRQVVTLQSDLLA
ncbi:hypothetical protein ACFCX4_21380 [Kitasatospora sp. NPDC056327]|uniref:hypothetical protein n=1 Tax=Kitasatospora sp. NPDC056327 TaxID=3345785 RepID=UPI0035D6F79B